MATATLDGMEQVRVVVVDDHWMIRDGLRRPQPGEVGDDDVVIVGDAQDVSTGVQVCEQLRPDVVLVDVRLGDTESGLDLLQQLRSVDSPPAVVLMSAWGDAEAIRRGISAGASGFVAKSSTRGEILGCIRKAAVGERSLDSASTAKLIDHLDTPAAQVSKLSPRERQVLSLASKGKTNDDIASDLLVSSQTVKTHMSRIFDKLGVRDRAQAVAEAIRAGALQ